MKNRKYLSIGCVLICALMLEEVGGMQQKVDQNKPLFQSQYSKQTPLQSSQQVKQSLQNQQKVAQNKPLSQSQYSKQTPLQSSQQVKRSLQNQQKVAQNKPLFQSQYSKQTPLQSSQQVKQSLQNQHKVDQNKPLFQSQYSKQTPLQSSQQVKQSLQNQQKVDQNKPLPQSQYSKQTPLQPNSSRASAKSPSQRIQSKSKVTSPKPLYIDKVGKVAKKCLDYLKPDLAEWYNEVNAIFSLKREVFAEKRSGIWKSYFGKDQTPKTLQSTIDSTGNLYKEEMKLLEDARISILDELKKVALGATKGSKEENAISRAIEDLEGGVKKLYELCCFIISHLDKEDQAFAKPESFRFEAEEILKKKTSKEEKLAELNKAYGEAEGRVDDIAKMVRGKAEEVSRGTGFAVKVNIPVGSFESIVMVVKNNLRKYQLEAEKFIRSLDSDNKVPLDG